MPLVLQAVSAHWRSDASLKVLNWCRLSKWQSPPNIPYAVNSFLNLCTEEFNGILNYNSNYQNFDPGSFKLRFTNYQDRTLLCKVAFTCKFADNRFVNLQYKYFNLLRLDGVVELMPFIYVGDGSVKEVPRIFFRNQFFHTRRRPFFDARYA